MLAAAGVIGSPACPLPVAGMGLTQRPRSPEDGVVPASLSGLVDLFT